MIAGSGCWAESAPVDPRNETVSRDLIGLAAAAVDEPQVALVDDRHKVTDLSLDGVGGPNGRLRLQACRVRGGEQHPPVRAIPVHHDQAVAARLALVREDRLQISKLVSLLLPVG